MSNGLAEESAMIDRVDVLVAGGGPAGVAAAIAAGRAGARTLLVERYGRLGGMAVQGLVSPIMGHADSPLADEIIERLGGPKVDFARTDLVYADMICEAGTDILLHAYVTGAVMDGSRVTGVTLHTKQGPVSISADVVVDATGDGDVALSAGVPFEQGRPSDGLTQPASIMFEVGGVDTSRALLCGSEEEAVARTVPEGTWADVVKRGGQTGELPESIGVIRTYEARRPSRVTVNATQVNRIDGTDPLDLTRAELEGRRQAYCVLEFLRRHAPGYEDAYISEMPAVIGVRETRRFLGVEYLERRHVAEGVKWETAVVRNASFVIDIHNPDGAGQAEGFAAKCRPYDIPYGCLVPREVDGLVLAGRCISGSHEAHASYRVQRICMAIGAASGTAAALAARQGTVPRSVLASDIQRILFR